MIDRLFDWLIDKNQKLYIHISHVFVCVLGANSASRDFS